MSDWPREMKRASEHDPFCHAAKIDYHDPECCECAALELARADERERIAQALESWDGWDSFGLSGWGLLHDAARIARQGGNP